MAVCLVVRHDGSRHIVELHITSIADHQHIISRHQKLIPEDLRHTERHGTLRRSIRERHSAGYRHRLCRACARRSACHLRRLIRVTECLYLRSAGCTMSSIYGNHLVFAVCSPIVIEYRTSAVDCGHPRIFPVGIHSDLISLIHIRL